MVDLADVRNTGPASIFFSWLKVVRCQWFHRGGQIIRDELGRINWECVDCGRRSDPVPLNTERQVVDRELEQLKKER